MRTVTYKLPINIEDPPRGKLFGEIPDAYSQDDATEDALDRALAATFPASDALSIIQPGRGRLPAKRRGHECSGAAEWPWE